MKSKVTIEQTTPNIKTIKIHYPKDPKLSDQLALGESELTQLKQLLSPEIKIKAEELKKVLYSAAKIQDTGSDITIHTVFDEQVKAVLDYLKGKQLLSVGWVEVNVLQGRLDKILKVTESMKEDFVIADIRKIASGEEPAKINKKGGRPCEKCGNWGDWCKCKK